MITRSGSQDATRGPAEHFTGDVRVQPLFPAVETATYSGAYVTFQPGAAPRGTRTRPVSD